MRIIKEEKLNTFTIKDLTLGKLIAIQNALKQPPITTLGKELLTTIDIAIKNEEENQNKFGG